MRHLLLASLVVSSLAAQSVGDRLPADASLREDAGALVHQNEGHLSRFDSAGAAFVGLDPTRKLPPARLQMRLADWGRGGAWRDAALVAPTAVSGSIVGYDHGSVEERYEVTATGFEQSFVLTERPPGYGDLTLGIDVTSPTLQAEPAAAAHQPLVFRAVTGQEVHYGEAFVFERGGRPVPIETRYDGAGRIELVVPAAFLDKASYPIVVDPIVGSPIQVGGTPYNDFECDVAFDSKTETYMVVWRRQFSVNDQRIRAWRYDSEGNSIGSLIQVTGSGFAVTPTVTVMDTGSQTLFYVLWSSSTGLMGRFYDAANGLPEAAHAVTNVALGTRDRRPDVATRGTEAVVVWDRTAVGSADPDRIMVTQLVRPSPGLVITGPVFDVTQVNSGYVRRPRIADRYQVTTAPQVHIVWERFYTSPAPGDFDIRRAHAILSTSGVTFLQAPTTVVGGGSIGVDEQRPDIAMLDRSPDPVYLMIWQDAADIYGTTIDFLGSVNLDFPIATGSDIQTDPAVGAGSCDFSVGYLSAPQGNPGSMSVVAARVLENATVADNDNMIDLSSAVQSGLRASSITNSSNPNERSDVMFAWTRDSTTGGVVRDVRAARYAPIGFTQFLVGSGCPGPGGNVPQISLNGEPLPGRQDFGFSISNAPPNSLAALLIGTVLTTMPIPGTLGCEAYLGLPLVTALPIVVGPTGAGSVPVPLPCQIPNNAFLGFQWAVFTPGHNAFGWITTADYDLQWGQ